MESYKVNPDSFMCDSLKPFHKHMPLIDYSQLCQHNKRSSKVVEIVAKKKKSGSGTWQFIFKCKILG